MFSIGWNLIGDGLRDVMDPRLRKGSAALRGAERGAGEPAAGEGEESDP